MKVVAGKMVKITAAALIALAVCTYVNHSSAAGGVCGVNQTHIWWPIDTYSYSCYNISCPTGMNCVGPYVEAGTGARYCDCV